MIFIPTSPYHEAGRFSLPPLAYRLYNNVWPCGHQTLRHPPLTYQASLHNERILLFYNCCTINIIVIKTSIKENDIVIKFQLNKIMILDKILPFLRS